MSSKFSRRSGAFLISDARFQLVRAAQDFGTAQDTQRARDQLSRTHRPAANSPSCPRLARSRRPREASPCSSWTRLPTFRFACSGRRRGETSLVHSPAVHSPAVDTPSRRSNVARLARDALLSCARLRSTARDPPSVARLVPAQSPHSGRATRRTPRAPTCKLLARDDVVTRRSWTHLPPLDSRIHDVAAARGRVRLDAAVTHAAWDPPSIRAGS